ncbi:zinc-binding dehydrogenase [Microbacterium aoyamense]|uniref:Zinc-binding dehydrogenase n=1 Tax=Microbacterium aoyamense TaxID=344166 RepID=A0ABP5AM78_9MICO|nr:alcohol dehydrogenase catalytic domain-containing protein [Microbacterium aoyamense]
MDASTTARQVVFDGVGAVRIDSIGLPSLGHDDVLVRIAMVGICATDLHLLAGHIGDPFPLVPGHEFVGEVAALGDGARVKRGIAVGDHVAVEMLLPCGACARCREGRYNLCEKDAPASGRDGGRQYGVNIPRTTAPGLWGGYAEYLFAPDAAVIHTMPSGLPWDHAVLVEPLAVAHRALARGRLRPGEDVVIIGPGPVGLLAAAAARASGAGRVIIVGTRPSRLALARRFGADAIVDSTTVEDLPGAVRDVLGGQLPDLVVETAGVVNAQVDAVRSVRRGGRVVLAGACGAGQTLGVLADEDLLTREIDVLPSFLSAGGFEPAIAQLNRGEFPFHELVTHRFALDDVERAFSLIESRADGVVKAVLEPRRTKE